MRKVAKHLGLNWMASPNAPQHVGAVGNQLSRIAYVQIALSAVLFLIGALTFQTGDPSAILVGIVIATSGFLSLAALNLNRLHLAVSVQAFSLPLSGLGMSLYHPQGWLILPAIALLMITHLATYRTRLYRHPARPIELLLSICIGAMIAGALVFAPSNETTVSGILSAVYLFATIASQWHSLARFGETDRNLPIARINEIQNAIERTGSGVAQFASDGALLSASPLLPAMLSCEPYSLRNKGFLRRIHLLDQPTFLKQVSDAAHGQSPRTVEVRAQTQAGSGGFVWMEISATRASSQVGKFESPEAIIVFRNVTERKKQHELLEAARLKAEQAVHTKSRFLATMGHELRTPLNAVVGFSEMMVGGIGGELSPAHQEYAGHIKESGRHLLEVVNMLLDMSKIEAGKFELDLSDFMPDRIVAPVTRMLDVQVRAKNLNIELDIQDNLPVISADERALRQVLINLISNATKFSEDGGSVQVAVRRQGTKILMGVRDFGVGMSKEDVDRLGEPFFQAAQGHGRRYEGTGLGLSIVKGLVELHDGSMHIDSQLGKGTSVTVLLPVNGPKPKNPSTHKVANLNSMTRKQAESEQWQHQRSAASLQAENHQERRNIAS